MSVSGLRKIRFNTYTPRRISTKKSVSKQTSIPVVHVNNFGLVSLRFSVPDLLCKFGLSVSSLRKIRFNAYTPLRISTKNPFPNKPGFPLSTLIILDWYPYVSLFLIYCVNLVRVSAVYAKYVSMPIHHFEFPQKNQFPNKPGFPLSTLIISDWYPYVSLFTDILCKFGSSVSSLRKIRFNAYTPLRISTKKSVPKQTRIPIVRVNNFRLVSLRFSVP